MNDLPTDIKDIKGKLHIDEDRVFVCNKYGLKMTFSQSEGFCARRFRKAQAGEYCIDCDKGRQAAARNADQVRTAIDDRRRAGKKKEEDMSGVASEKVCVDCRDKYKPTSNVQQRCVKCRDARKASPANRKPSQAKHSASSGKARRMKGNGHAHDECEGCKALQMKIDNLCRGAIIGMVNSMPSEKLEKAMDAVRGLQ